MANSTCKIDASWPACNICSRLIFNRGTSSEMTVCGKNLISVNLVEMYNSSDGITMGASCANALTVDMIVPSGLAFKTAMIEPVVTIDDADTALGTFYVCGHTTENKYKTVTLECYDPFCRTEEKYAPGIDAPASIEEVAADIAGQCGFEIDYDFSPYAHIQIPWYGDYTCRQMIGYIAGLMGKNARFNRNGKLTFSWYEDNDITIERERQYINQFKILKSDTQKVNSVSSGTEEERFSKGDGLGIAFENPYMTGEILEAIYDEVHGFEFQPCSVAHRGDLRILPGTRIKIKDDTGGDVYACVMEHNMIINGGLSSTLYSYGKEDINYSFESNNSSKTLSQLSSRMDRAMMMTKEINDSKGGVFQIIDADGDGINDSFIMRNADGKGSFIRGNKDGIGFSKDGGDTYTTAINEQGICTEALNVKEIFAEEIGVSGVEFSDMLKVQEDEQEGMIMTIGSGTNNVIMQQENDQIAFYEKTDEAKKVLCSFGVQTGTGKKVITLGNLSIEAWPSGRITFSTGGDK